MALYVAQSRAGAWTEFQSTLVTFSGPDETHPGIVSKNFRLADIFSKSSGNFYSYGDTVTSLGTLGYSKVVGADQTKNGQNRFVLNNDDFDDDGDCVGFAFIRSISKNPLNLTNSILAVSTRQTSAHPVSACASFW